MWGAAAGRAESPGGGLWAQGVREPGALWERKMCSVNAAGELATRWWQVSVMSEGMGAQCPGHAGVLGAST